MVSGHETITFYIEKPKITSFILIRRTLGEDRMYKRIHFRILEDALWNHGQMHENLCSSIESELLSTSLKKKKKLGSVVV